MKTLLVPRSSSIPEETSKTNQAFEQQLESLYDRCLSEIETEAELPLDSYVSFLETRYSEDSCKFLVLNALLKRIRHFYPKSVNFIDRERNRFSPNSRFENSATGPTPEILMAALNMYVPFEHDEIYMNFLKEKFPHSFFEIDSNEESISGSDPHSEKQPNADPISILEIRQWMEEIKKEKPQHLKKIRRAVHPRP